MNAIAHDYPQSPGHRGVDTSLEAAASIKGVQGRLQRMAFFAIEAAGGKGLTTQELARRLQLDAGTIQPRTSELRRLGLITDSGERRPNANGKRAIVWVASGWGEQANG